MKQQQAQQQVEKWNNEEKSRGDTLDLAATRKSKRKLNPLVSVLGDNSKLGS